MKYLIRCNDRVYLATCIKYPEHPNTWYHFYLEDGSKRIVSLRNSAIISSGSSDNILEHRQSSDQMKKITYLIKALEAICN